MKLNEIRGSNRCLKLINDTDNFLKRNYAKEKTINDVFKSF